MSLVIVLDSNYSPNLKSFAVKDDGIYRGIRTQTCIKDVSLPYNYGASSIPHDELLSNNDDAILVCASMDTLSSF